MFVVSGQDFDFPILKTIARRFNLKMPIHQYYFRDCRTYILESAIVLTHQKIIKSCGDVLTSEKIINDPMLGYDLIPKLSSKTTKNKTKHDALYDCLRSTWGVWNCMKFLQNK